MRSTQTCPKCAGRRFATTSEFQVPDERGEGGRSVKAVPAFTAESKSRGLMGTSTISMTTGHFEQWICLGCGYTEFYVNDLESIERAAKEFPLRLRIVDAVPPDRGPYR